MQYQLIPEQTHTGRLPAGVTWSLAGRLHNVGSGLTTLALLAVALLSLRTKERPTLRRLSLVLLAWETPTVTSTEQFIASLVHSLAWPGALVAVVLAFRSQLSKLLLGARLSGLRAGPVDLVFDQQLAKVEERVAEELPAVENRRGDLGKRRDKPAWRSE